MEENFEAVLQALDEFQKMRPTDIPGVLEEYLCWVSKTGNPVFQWPMIKTLFREKLISVMTDYYENYPTLELTPCPNVEHFNYDSMKSNLLERLESFASAPFTVQRICELLTAPRQEYNRVDKFMRAIEKNILVVSTCEPRPLGRRGETGDGMVNGSVEEDAASITQQQQQSVPSPPPSPLPSSSPSQLPQTAQPAQLTQPASQDVEMEYWEKDCTSTVTISVHTVENEPSLLHNVIPGATSALAKSTPVYTADETAREKLEQTACRTEQLATSNFIPAASDFSAISNLTSQIEQSHESISSSVSAIPVVQSLPTSVAMVSEDSTTIKGTDIAEGILNEDAASQSNLDMEIEATTTATTMTTTSTSTTTSAATTTVTVVATVIPLTTDTTRKLHAALQAKRFEPGNGKCSDNDKPNEKMVTSVAGTEDGIAQPAKSIDVTSIKPSPEHVDSNGIPHDESRLTDLLKTNVDARSNTENATSIIEKIPSRSEEEPPSLLEDTDEQGLRSKIDEDARAASVFIESRIAERDGTAVEPEEYVSAVIVSSSEALHRTEKSKVRSMETPATIPSGESFTHDQHESTDQNTDDTEMTDKILEPVPRPSMSVRSDDDEQEMQCSEFGADGSRVMESVNDRATLVEPMASESARIVERSGEVTTVIEKLETISPIMEMTQVGTDNTIPSVVCGFPTDNKSMRIEEGSLTCTQDNDAVCIAMERKHSSVIESGAVCRREPMELMEVDNEEPTSMYQQDEQMEQESMEELSKS